MVPVSKNNAESFRVIVCSLTRKLFLLCQNTYRNSLIRTFFICLHILIAAGINYTKGITRDGKD